MIHGLFFKVSLLNEHLTRSVEHRLGSGTYHAFGFWTEHLNSYVPSNTDLKQYALSISELEKKTGMDFFCNLPDNIENEVEKKNSYSSLY